jgi:hypothetical protein
MGQDCDEARGLGTNYLAQAKFEFRVLDFLPLQLGDLRISKWHVTRIQFASSAAVKA